MSESRQDTPTQLIALACQRALAAEKFETSNGFKYKLVRMPCSSKVEPAMILRAFEAGAKGVALIPCAIETCQYVEGNLRARSLAKGAAGLLTEIGIDPQRFEIYPLVKEHRTGIDEFLNAFARRIESLGEWL